MKALFKFAFAICSTAIILSSCGKSNEEGKMIPKNAMFVAQLNTKSLANKLSWEDIKKTSWYQKTYSDPKTPEWRKKILDDPTASGIDFNKGLIFFMNKGEGTGYTIVAEGTIKSEKDFEAFNKNFDPSQTVKNEAGIRLLTLKDKNVVGWNNKHFAYVMNSKTTSSEMYSWEDTANSSSGMYPADNSAELSAVCVKIFALQPDSSLEKNEKFGALLQDKGDIHIWQNTEEIMKSSPLGGMLGMVKLDAFFTGNISAYTVNFEKGKIEIDQKAYAGKELTGVLKKYMNGKINTDMIRNIPSKNVFAVLAANFKPEGIKELIKLTGADGIVNTYAQQLGFSLDDLSKSGNGDLLLAITDLTAGADSFNYKDNRENEAFSGRFPRPDFNYIFAAGISDKASLQKLINAGKKIISQAGNDSLAHYNMNDKTFVLSNSTGYAKQFLAGGNNKYDFINKINGHPVGVFIDLHKILSVIATETGNKPDAKMMLDENLKTWNTFVMTGDNYKGNSFTAKTVISLLDPSVNSAKQLNTYFDEMYQLKESGKTVNSRRLDSLLTPPPIDTIEAK